MSFPPFNFPAPATYNYTTDGIVPIPVVAERSPIQWNFSSLSTDATADLNWLLQYRFYRDRENWKGVMGMSLTAPTEWISYLTGYRRVSLIVTVKLNTSELWNAFPSGLPTIDVLTFLRFQHSLRAEGVVTAARDLFVRFIVTGVTDVVQKLPYLLKMNFHFDAIPADDVAEVNIDNYINFFYRVDDDQYVITDAEVPVPSDDLSYELSNLFTPEPIMIKPSHVVVKLHEDGSSRTSFSEWEKF